MQRRWSPTLRDAEPASRGIRAPGTTLHSTLRETIRREQRSVDRTLALLDLTVRSDYVYFLRVNIVALRGLANKWREADRTDFEALIGCLRDDLRAMGANADCGPVTPHRNLAMSLRSWGVSYVIRASRSSCRIRRSHLSEGFASSYLDYSPGIAWPQFLAQLDRDVQSHQTHEVEQVIRGARTALSAFSTAAAEQLQIPAENIDRTS